jgi:SAM-dependent methyltransferase
MNDPLRTVRHFWDDLAERDPLWAILSDPSKRGGRWDLRSFFATGEREISLLLHQLEGLPGGGLTSRRTALDFGCGVGRLTQALALHFTTVAGVDVSPTMLAHARRLNGHGDRVEYVHNERDDLAVLGDKRFDLVYTDLVLQHLPPQRAMRYVSELLRVVADGGLLVFQLPSHRRSTPAAEVTPMEDAAYRAQIEVVEFPAEWPPGGSAALVVRVTNTSGVPWDQASVGSIRLGNHWLSPTGAMLVQDDGRGALPLLMGLGQSATTTLRVNVHSGDAARLLELDLVHEGLSWFADRGSSTLRIEIAPEQSDVRPIAGDSPDVSERDESLLRPFIRPDSADDVAFPMHGVPRKEVEAWLRSHSGQLVLAESDDRGGREWEGFRYFVRNLKTGNR